jgi:hypothetical protein
MALHGAMQPAMSSDYARWRIEFAKALDPAHYTIEWVDAQLEAGLYLLDATDKAAILTEAKVYPTGVWEVHGVLAAGDMREIADILIPLAEERARRAGAIGASIASRPGWARVLKSRGYRIDQVEVRKDLRE